MELVCCSLERDGISNFFISHVCIASGVSFVKVSNSTAKGPTSRVRIRYATNGHLGGNFLGMVDLAHVQGELLRDADVGA